MSLAYYNEIDPYAAQWLRNLIDAGHIAPGVVDERSIEDVRPEELAGFVQCHFFAGIGGWAHALDLAGWPRDRPVWTGSCPCQPFSAAGKGNGFADQRHLWPAWQHLIAQCRPTEMFGEQVASKAVDPWIDLVQADLENLDYAVGCEPFPAAGIRAPHIRDRSYWVAHANRERRYRKHTLLRPDARGRNEADLSEDAGVCSIGGMAAAYGSSGGQGGSNVRGRIDGGHAESWTGSGGSSMLIGMAHPGGSGLAQRQQLTGVSGEAPGAISRETVERGGIRPVIEPGRTRTLDSFWGAADWLRCRDGKWRPVEPGTFPLAHGVSGRVGRLRAYGNAIVPQQAAEFVLAYLEGRHPERSMTTNYISAAREMQS